jgi:hypothetical protein
VRKIISFLLLSLATFTLALMTVIVFAQGG